MCDTGAVDGAPVAGGRSGGAVCTGVRERAPPVAETGQETEHHRQLRVSGQTST